MQIRDLSKPITAQSLNESLSKKFGYKLNLEQFTDVQLEDARNKLRTKISQFEVSESFDSVNESPAYQKTRLMLDCVNQEILEREMTPADKSKEKNLKAKFDKSDMKKSMKKQYGENKGKQIYFATIRKKAMDHSVPESWIDSAINRMSLGESDQSELIAELTTRYDLNENTANYILYLAEGESEKAEVIMATKDMVDQITGWLEDVAAMKSEHLLELMDSIRENFGSDVAQKYEQAVKPALDQIYSAIEQARSGITSGLSIVSGGEADTMGAEPTPDAGSPDMGGAPDIGGAPDMGAEPAPELPAPEAEAGREKRESVDYSRRLGILLNSKKK